jgi:hypothetical protein
VLEFGDYRKVVANVQSVVACSPGTVYNVLRQADVLRPRGKESRKGKGFVQPLPLPFAQSQPTHLAEPVDGPQHPSKDLPKISVRFSRSLNRPNSESRLTSTLLAAGWLQPTIPDKPRSSRQRYRTMELGQQIRSQHIDN